MNKEINITIGWTAFINGQACVGYKEFAKGGKYVGTLTLITKPTEEELKAELEKLKITIVK